MFALGLLLALLSFASVTSAQSSGPAPRPPPEEIRSFAATCDELAASQTDQSKPKSIVGLHLSRIYPYRAIEPCERAARAIPDEPRYAYQHCRVLKALARHQDATEACAAAAAREHPGALFELAMASYTGRGRPLDRVSAVAQIQRAADLGSAEAHQVLAQLYSEGKHLPRNAANAYRHHAKAAELGDDHAMFDVAASLNDGNGTPRDVEKAARVLTHLVEKMRQLSDSSDLDLLRKAQFNLEVVRRNLNRPSTDPLMDWRARQSDIDQAHKERMRQLLGSY